MGSILMEWILKLANNEQLLKIITKLLEMNKNTVNENYPTMYVY